LQKWALSCPHDRNHPPKGSEPPQSEMPSAALSQIYFLTSRKAHCPDCPSQPPG
jgi:hypothetical protein